MTPPPTRRPHTRGDKLRLAAVAVAVAALSVSAFLQSAADERSFAVNLSNALGFAAVALMIVQLLAPAAPHGTSSPFRPTLLLRLRGPFGYAALAAAVGHLVLLIVDDTDALGLLDPIDAPGRARAAVIALVALAALTVFSQRRRRHRRQSRAWRAVHVVLGAVALAFAAGHIAGVREYLGLDVVTGTLLALVPVAAVAVVYLWPERPRSEPVDSRA